MSLAAIASLLLAAAAVQGKPVPLETLIRALAEAKDPEALAAALKPFDAMDSANLRSIRLEAEWIGPAAAEAVRRHLPHPIWYDALGRVNLGEMLRREKELGLGEAKANPRDFALAAQRHLASRDAGTRLLALKLLGSLQSPKPEELVPFLSDANPQAVDAAGRALAIVGGPEASRALLAALKGKPSALFPLNVPAARLLGPESTPELVALLKTGSARGTGVLGLLAKTADSRAEPALVALIPDGRTDPEALSAALVAVGGEPSIAALLAALADPATPEAKRRPWLDGLVGLRAPGTAALLLKEAAEGRARLAEQRPRLERLGDASIAPDLVAIARDTKARLDDRRAALELLGLFGGPEQRGLLEEQLADPRFAAAAAAGLAEIGDARSARPLAEALKVSPDGRPFARAILALPGPLEGMDEPLREILEDPAGHRTGLDALRAAARAKRGPLTEFLLQRLVDPKPRSHWPLAWVSALVPVLRDEDRALLMRGFRSDDGALGHACAVALGSMGDGAALRRALRESAASGSKLHLASGVVGLEGWPAAEKDLRPAVAEVYAERPAWLEGALWLARRGDPAGRELLRRTLEDYRGGERLAEAAAGLLALKDPDAPRMLIPHLVRNPRVFVEDGAVAAAFDDASLQRFRDDVLSNLHEVGWDPMARFLARRPDPALAPFLVGVLRPSYQELSTSGNEAVFAESAARLKLPDARPVLRRWLKEPWPGRRAQAAKALALYGDPAELPFLVPLLDDLQARPDAGRDPYARVARVGDAAVEAVEQLGGEKFTGGPAERRRAARAKVLTK